MFCDAGLQYIIALMHFPFRQYFFRAIFAQVRSSEGHVLSQVISQLKICKKMTFLPHKTCEPAVRLAKAGQKIMLYICIRWANITQDSWEHRAALPGFLGNDFPGGP